MNWIITPEVNAAGRRVVRRGPGEHQGLRPDRRQGRTATRSTPRTRTTLDRSGTGPRRSECLDGRTDVKCTAYGEWTAGLERDQGLTADRVASSRRPAVRPAWPPASRRALTARPRLRLAGAARAADDRGSSLVYLGAARSSLLLTAFWTVDEFTDDVVRDVHAGQLPGRPGRAGLPDAYRSARSASPPR